MYTLGILAVCVLGVWIIFEAIAASGKVTTQERNQRGGSDET